MHNYNSVEILTVIKLEWPDISSWGQDFFRGNNNKGRQQQRFNTIHRDRRGGVKERREYSRAVSTTPNKRDYLDRDLNRDSDSTFFSCVDTINAIVSGI